MLIEDHRTNAGEKFGNIPMGNCFEFEGEVYIKTDISDRPRNALSLTCNTAGYFNAPDIVIPINAKVVIE